MGFDLGDRARGVVVGCRPRHQRAENSCVVFSDQQDVTRGVAFSLICDRASPSARRHLGRPFVHALLPRRVWHLTAMCRQK
jgi:hypothetical protein